MKSERRIYMSVLLVLLVTAGLLVVTAVPSIAAEKPSDAQAIVDKARVTFNDFMNDPQYAWLHDHMKDAKGLLIFPQILKAGYILGGSGGTGVLVLKDQKSCKWSEPAFYTIGEASYGLQIGGEASQVILLAMTERGVKSLLANSAKLGGDAGVAVGPVGMGAAAATANLSADILSFSRSKGLYGGISFDGAVVAVRPGLNEAFYGKKVSPADILIGHDVRNSRAMALIEDLTKSAARKSASLQ